MTGTVDVRGELVDRLVLEDAQHERVDVLADGAGEVGERLAPAEADLVAGQEQARAAELGDAASKLTRVRSDGFSKTSADHPAGERVRRAAPRVRGLQPGGLRQQVRQLVGGQVEQVKEVSHGCRVVKSCSRQVVRSGADLTT